MEVYPPPQMKFLQLTYLDFRTANILIRLANLDHLSEDELISLVGAPERSEVMTESGEELPSSTPSYLVPALGFLLSDSRYMTDQICIIDFGESIPMASPPTDLGIPEEYLPPEVLIEGGSAIGVGSDLWALGCTLFEIRRQMPLFYMINEKDELLAERVYFLGGKLPGRLWGKWEGRADFFEENGKRIEVEGVNREAYTLRTVLNHKL